MKIQTVVIALARLLCNLAVPVVNSAATAVRVVTVVLVVLAV